MNKIGLKRNRIITMILTVCMIVALIPLNVFADTTYTTTFTYQSKSFKVSKPTGSAYTFLLSDVLIMLDIDGDVKNLSLEDLGALSAEKKNNVWYLTMNNNFVNGEMTVTYADDSSKTIKYSVGQDSIGVAFYGFLNFDAADGTGELITTASGKTYTNQMYCRQGYSYVLPECPYEKEGYTFAGWEIYGSVYQPGETFLFTGTTKAITLWMNNEGEIVNQSDSYPITVDSQVTNGSFDVPSYARAGQTITINPVADAGYSVYNVTVNGKIVNPVNGVYSFKMTSTATTVSGAFYRSLDGGTESAPVLLNDTSVCYLTGGWYNVSGRTSFNHQIIFANDTHLVLEDGCEMSVTGLGKDAAIRSIMDNSTVDTLSIHGDTGKLNLTNGTNYGIYAGYFNLYGGNITVSSTSVIPAIQAYKDIKIVDGSINANKSTIVSEQGNVYINGGKIVLTNTGLTTKSINCKNYDLKISGGALDTSGAVYGNNVRISSGQVSVKKLEYYREFVLGCSNAEDFISTTSIATSYGYVQKITEGIVLKDENENEYQGTLTKTDAVALGGKKLSLASTYDADYKVTVKAANFGTLKANKTTAKPGELVTITASPVKGFKLKELLCNNIIVLPNTAGEYLINMPYEDVTINAVFVKQTFTVTWKNIDGTVLEIDENVEYGSAPFYDGEEPIKNGSASAFIGWDKEYSAVIEDVTYTAQYGEEIEHSHKMIKTDAKEATCKEAGSNEYYTCETCEKIFKDANGQIETTVEAEIIAATGNHNFSVSVNETTHKCADCDATENHVFSNDSDTTCDVCGYVRTVTEENPTSDEMIYEVDINGIHHVKYDEEAEMYICQDKDCGKQIVPGYYDAEGEYLADGYAEYYLPLDDILFFAKYALLGDLENIDRFCFETDLDRLSPVEIVDLHNVNMARYINFKNFARVRIVNLGSLYRCDDKDLKKSSIEKVIVHPGNPANIEVYDGVEIIEAPHTYIVEDSEHHSCSVCYIYEEHDFSDDTCQGECACGLKNEAGNHNFSDGKCTLCGAYEDAIGAKLAGYTISLKEKIGVNFYMELSDNVAADNNAKMVIALPDGTTDEVSVSEARREEVNGKTYYVFDCYVAAKEMTAPIKAHMVLSDGTEGKEFEYTVQEYAQYILEHAESYASAVLVVKAMMNYGTAAQTYFNYNIGKMANSILDEADRNLGNAPSLSDYAYAYPEATEDTSFFGTSLVLKTAVRAKFYVKTANDLTKDDITVTLDGAAVDPARILIGKDGSYQYITITDVNPEDYGKKISITVGDLTLQNASVYGYMEKVISDESESDVMRNLVTALYYYGAASADYAN